MNTENLIIISDFQEEVKDASELLKKFLETDEPHNWGPPIEQVGMPVDKHKYFFHGVGGKVQISKKDVVDFDYGANGRIDGFDEWTLCGFIRTRRKQYPNVRESDIKQRIIAAFEAKEIEKSDSRGYGNLYYLV